MWRGETKAAAVERAKGVQRRLRRALKIYGSE
jgi:hypothetical protein